MEGQCWCTGKLLCVSILTECLSSTHSWAGVSRSVTIVVMYLMTVSQLSFEDAMRVLKYCRVMSNPNSGFREQLVQYQENKLFEVKHVDLMSLQSGVWCFQERARVKERFPDSDKLKDDDTLQELSKQAKEHVKEEDRVNIERHTSSGSAFIIIFDDDDV